MSELVWKRLRIEGDLDVTVELVDGGLNIRPRKTKVKADGARAGKPEHLEMSGLRAIAENMTGVPGGVPAPEPGEHEDPQPAAAWEPGKIHVGAPGDATPVWLAEKVEYSVIQRYAKGAVAVLTAIVVVLTQVADGQFDPEAIAAATIACLGALGVIVIPNRKAGP